METDLVPVNATTVVFFPSTSRPEHQLLVCRDSKNHDHHPDKTIGALRRALQEEHRSFVCLSAAETRQVLCLSPDDEERFSTALWETEVALTNVAKGQDEKVLGGKSPWLWVRGLQGVSNISGGFSRQRDVWSPVEGRNERLFLSHKNLASLERQVPSAGKLFGATRLLAWQDRALQRTRVSFFPLEGSLLFQQVLDEETKTLLPKFTQKGRRVQPPHADGHCDDVCNFIVALHKDTSLLFYRGGGKDGVTRVVLEQPGASVAFLETTIHGGDSWVRSKTSAPHFLFRAFFSLSFDKDSTGQGVRSTMSEISVLDVASDAVEAKKEMQAAKLQQNKKRHRPVGQRSRNRGRKQTGKKKGKEDK